MKREHFTITARFEDEELKRIDAIVAALRKKTKMNVGRADIVHICIRSQLGALEKQYEDKPTAAAELIDAVVAAGDRSTPFPAGKEALQTGGFRNGLGEL